MLLYRWALRGLFAAAVMLVLTSQVAFGQAAFPSGYGAYHTYAGLTSALRAYAANASIVRLTSIGQSYQGRQLWMVEISGDVAAQGRAKPEVLVTGLTHAREHLGVEQALALIGWLVNGYGHDAAITQLVNTTRIWVAPMLNPDGGQFDIAGGRFHNWRKNRQPAPGSSALGTDINRNFGYRWGCCGGSSSNPLAITYRGPSPFSTPEARAERAFVLSRVVNGRQQLRLALSFHSFGAQILYPYGYTKAPLPGDMVPADRSAMVALADGTAARDGYQPMQESHLYITSGTFLDWGYGAQRILTFTMELGPRTTAAGGFYPRSGQIGPLTAANRSALLWFLGQASCPYNAAGLGEVCAVRYGALLPGAAGTLATRFGRPYRI